MRAAGMAEAPSGKAGLLTNWKRMGQWLAHNSTARWFAELAHLWRDEQVSRLSAAISFYALLSLIPLLITADALLGLVLEHQTISRHFEAEVASLIGGDSAKTVSDMLDHARSPTVMSWQALIGGVVTFVAAAGVFIELKYSMNSLWNVPQSERLTWWRKIASYFAPLSMVLGFGFLLLVSLVVGAMVSGVSATLITWNPSLAAGLALSHWLVSGLISLFLFAAIFRLLPDTFVGWRQVLFGALVTAILHTIGRIFIGVYLGNSDFTGRYGLSGAVIAIVIWIYYSAQILFTGALISRMSSESAKKPLPNLRHPAHTR